MLPDQNKCSLTLRIDFSFLRLKTRYVLEQLFLYNPTLFPTLCIKFAQNNNNLTTLLLAKGNFLKIRSYGSFLILKLQKSVVTENGEIFP